MQISPTTSAELANHQYESIMPSVYACPESGRVLIIQADESALLILTDEKK